MSRAFFAREEFRKPICPRGHDKVEVGVHSSSRICWACYKLYRVKQTETGSSSPVFLPESAFRSPYCIHGHYKPEVGIQNGRRGCFACFKEVHRKSSKRFRDEKARHRPPSGQNVIPELEKIREFFGWTISEMASQLGLPLNTYWGWLRTGKRPKPMSIEKMAPHLPRLIKMKNEAITKREEERAQRERHQHIAHQSGKSTFNRLNYPRSRNDAA